MESEKGHWFQETSHPEGLPAPKDLSGSHDRFRKRLRLALGKGDQTKTVQNTQDGLIRQIEDARNAPLRQLSAVQLVRRASAAHNNYVIDRETGSKRMRNWVQSHTEVLLTFVEKFSKVIEAVATAGGPYSTIAYETLSIMVIVVRDKVNNDNKVVNLLDEIRKSLPRLENWENIYPTKSMRSLVVSVYLHVIEFSKRAAEYFTHFRKRLKLAFFPGFVTGFDEIGIEIRTALADINNEAMYGLHQRTQHIYHQNDSSGKRIEYLKELADKGELKQQELLTQNRKLITQNEEAEESLQRLFQLNKSLKLELEHQRLKSELRDKQENDRGLQAFSELLKVPLDHPGTKIDATKKSLTEVFPDTPPNPLLVPYTGYRQASRDLLYSSAEYRRWHDAKEPSLLFIRGSTDWHGRKETGLLHCWLSPFSIYIAEDASREDGVIVTFFSGLPHLEPAPVSTNMAISSIILQIIQRCPEILRENDYQFRRLLKRAGIPWLTKSLIDLLGEVLSRLTNETARTIYIVIDRLDCCAEHSLPRVMELLSSMITKLRSPSVNIKLAVIAETSEGNAEWHSEWLSRSNFDLRRLIVRHDWDQEKLPSWLSLTGSRPLIWSSKSAPSVMTLNPTNGFV